MKRKEDLDKAMEWAFKNLLGKRYYCPAIKSYVKFTEGGIKHSVKSKTYPTKIKLIYLSVQMLRNAQKIWEGEDKKSRAEIKRIYHLKSSTIIDGISKDVYIVLREMKDGTVYYDHNTQKKP